MARDLSFDYEDFIETEQISYKEPKDNYSAEIDLDDANKFFIFRGGFSNEENEGETTFSMLSYTEKEGDDQMLLQNKDSKIFIRALNKNVYIYSNEGKENVGNKPLKLDCKELFIEGKYPAIKTTKIIPTQANLGCVHKAAQIVSNAGVMYATKPPSVTVVSGATLGIIPNQGGYLLGVKVEGIVLPKLVKNTSWYMGGESYFLAVVGDPIQLKDHKFKKVTEDLVPSFSATYSIPNLYTYPKNSMAPDPSISAVSQISMAGNDELSGDQPDGKDVEVENSITDSGSSKTVYCENKLIGLVNNKNVCKNDSKVEGDHKNCLMIGTDLK